MRSIIIVGAGVMQIPAIRTAKKMGLRVIATDRNPAAEGFAYADVPVVMDTKDVAGHSLWALEHREKYNIVGAFAAADTAVTVAGITNALGLPGIPYDVALRSNNKALMKKRWLIDGVATPYAVEVSNVTEARRAAREIGFPLMVKAIDQAASRGTRKVEHAGVGFETALRDAMHYSSTKTALVEEYVNGEEQTVETIVYNGRHYHFGIADRHFGFSPFPIETGHTNPSRLPDSMYEELYNLTEKAAKSLGIDFGPAKADTIITKKGPMILEMPARLSGGFHSMYTTPIATGMDPIRAALTLAVGGAMPETIAMPTRARVAVCKAIFPEPGRIVSIDGVEKAMKLPGVEHVFLMVKKGDVVSDYRNCADRVCYIITSGRTKKEADAAFEAAADTIKIIIERIL